MRKPTLLMGPQAKKTMTGIPAQANKPQEFRKDIWGRPKPIGSYSMVDFNAKEKRNVSH
jgi:hypothetical protein